MKFIRNTLINLLLAVVILAILAIIFADKLIFLPPKHEKLDKNSFTMIDGDGFSLATTFFEAQKDSPVLLYSHGNAEDIIFLQGMFRLYRGRGFTIFGYDYEGYGASTGKPSEKNTYRDIEAAYNYLTNVKKIPAKQIFLYGRSIGSGPSIMLATKKPVGGLILESPFKSICAIVTTFALPAFDTYPNIDRIGKIKVPILIFHGKLDKVVRYSNGEALAKKANANAKLVTLPNSGHNDILTKDAEIYWKELKKFVEENKK